MQTIEEALFKLSHSQFRASFHLSAALRGYVNEKGMEKIREHARDFVHARLAPAYIPNDGKQTPMRGHPVFVAQHATATCCRGCLKKWYRVREGAELTAVQEEKIVNLIMAWIEKEMQREYGRN
ncbi:MAG: DUF4186 domain-containing protein [Clostridia bacterium]|nr:DUF4186 domain-containing protein [Clostridia bacterium]